MSRTTTELATEVMRLPNWIAQHETPDAADAAHIKRVYSDWFAYAQEQDRDIVYWAEATIPNAAFLPVVRIIADLCGPSFGDPAPQEIDVETGQPVSMGKKGWNMLKRLTSRSTSGLPAKTAYF
jgi:hypothetical protein